MYEETTGAGYAGEKKNSCGQTPVSPKETAAGHLAALLTIFIWGTTFISTKVLLVCRFFCRLCRRNGRHRAHQPERLRPAAQS